MKQILNKKSKLTLLIAMFLLTTTVHSFAQALVASAGANTNVCMGSGAPLNGSASGGTPGYGYSWLPTAGLSSTNVASPMASPAATTTYTLTVTDAIASTATAYITIVVNPIPVLTVSPTAQTICHSTNTSFGLSSNVGSTSYSWTVTQSGVSGATNNSGSVVMEYLNTTGTAAGTATYIITPTSSNGCVGNSVTAIATVNPAPTVTGTGTAAICSGSAVNYTFTSDIAATYIWTASDNSNVTGESLSNQTSNTINNTLTSSTSSPQNVNYTVQPVSTSGCYGIFYPITVTVNAIPVITSTPSSVTICSGSTANITSTSSVSGTSFAWTVSQSGVSGTSNGFSSAISQVLNTTGVTPGTATYSMTGTAFGCTGSSATSVVTVNPMPTVSVNNPTICSGGSATLTANPSISGGVFSWAPGGGTTSSITVSPASTITYTCSYSKSGCSNNGFGTVTVNASGTSSAGANQTICAGGTISLSGSIGGSATTSTWTTSGTGSFANAASTNTTYTPSIADKTAGTVTLTLTANGSCPPATSTMVVIINPPATVNAGADQAVCQGSAISITGSIGGSASSSTWTTSGTGSFANAASFSTTYTPSASDISVGSATLTLTTNDPAGVCPAANDFMVLTITQAANATAGANQTICAGGAVTLAGSIGGSATSSIWTSSGTGTFTSTTSLAPVYTPSLADITAGSVTLTLTTNDPAGACTSATSNMVLTIMPLQNASFNYASGTYCQSGTDPMPTITGVAGGTFTSTPAGLLINASTGTITLASSSLNTYAVTYTTTGTCANSSNVNVTISSAPSASFSYAGPYCQAATNPFPSFSGGASAGVFSSTVGLVFVNVNTGQIDLSSSAPGTYTVTNTIAASGGCSAATSTFNATINSPAMVTAGANGTICGSSTYTLAGTMSGSASSVTWTTSGTGTFNNPVSLSAVYTPSATDISAGSVTLTLTSNDPAGPCAAATSNMILTINAPATVSAGSSATICGGSNYSLSGSMGGGASSGAWTTSGTGTFNNPAFLSAVYTPSAADISAGFVTLTIMSNDPVGPCPAATSNMTLGINQPATASAGANQSICEGSTATLTGSRSGIATSSTWTSSGTGTFNNSSSLTPVYTPSSADISAGTVTLTLTTDDPFGPCGAATSSMVLNINPTPPLNVNSPSICSGSSAMLNATGATTYSWTPSAGLSNPNIANPLASPAFTTTYTITGSAGACTNTVISTVTVMPLPSATVSGGGTVCIGTTAPSIAISLTGVAPWNLNYTDGSLSVPVVANASPYIIANPTSGVYNVTSISDANTCNGTFNGSATVTINPLPLVSITHSGPLNFCQGDSVILVSSAASTYSWSCGVVTQNAIIKSTQIDSVTVTDINGCTATSPPITVTVAPSTDVTGHVSFTGGNVIVGNVSIYKYEAMNTSFVSIQTTLLDASGNYTFTAIPYGDYLIKVFADATIYPTLIPTYFGNQFIWQSAAVLTHGCGIVDVANVTMSEITPGSNAVPGTLSGSIVQGAFFQGQNFSRVEGDPIPGVDVKLGKNPGGIMASTLTDASGHYHFDNVDTSCYVLYIDIPGLNNIDSSYSVCVNATTTTFNNLNYVTDSSTVHLISASTGVNSTSLMLDNKFNVYPNPAKGNITIEYSITNNANVSISIYNVLGVKVKSLLSANQQEGQYKFGINNDLKTGIYFITLSIGANTTTQRIVVIE